MKSKIVFSLFFTAFSGFALAMLWLWLLWFHSWILVVYAVLAIGGARLAYYLACEAKTSDL